MKLTSRWSETYPDGSKWYQPNIPRCLECVVSVSGSEKGGIKTYSTKNKMPSLSRDRSRGGRTRRWLRIPALNRRAYHKMVIRNAVSATDIPIVLLRGSIQGQRSKDVGRSETHHDAIVFFDVTVVKQPRRGTNGGARKTPFCASLARTIALKSNTASKAEW